jgi:TrmH family RNA methyltransferase
MKTIASRQNPIVRVFRELAKQPDPHGARLLLDGAHLVRDAADAGLEFEVVCVASSHLDHETEEGALAVVLEQRAVDVVAIPDHLFASISPVRTPSGIVAIARRRLPQPEADEIFRSQTALALVGIDIQEPGNVGALVRVAEAAGACGALLSGESANPFSWKALRGSMGSGLRLPVLYEPSPAHALETLRARRVRTVAAVARGGIAPDRAPWSGRVAVIVGGEGPGLSDAIAAGCDVRVTIPMAPTVESLNVTVAAAILLYEARRHRESA